MKARSRRPLADDGTSLLPSSEWKRKINFPKLSEDRASALIEVELKLPAAGVKGLKELSGKLEYQVASATKEVDLGFAEFESPRQGARNWARRSSPSRRAGNKDGSQQMELKLNLKRESLKAVWLVVEGGKTDVGTARLRRRAAKSYTFTYESKTAFPANGKLVAEVYDQVQTFTTTFKLENISLLGTPLNGN